MSTIPAPEPAFSEPPAPATPETFVMPPSSYMHKGRRYNLICEGTCVDCARCGIKLTDSVSLERGIGPDCSAKGYLEDPQNADEIQAFIDLAEYPALCDYLTSKYKPLGVRGLMKGLVKIASLNRRSPGLHASICDAIESLGYKRLSAALRDSIAVIEIKESKKRPNSYQVRVKKSDWSYAWSNDLRNLAGVSRFEKLERGEHAGFVLVPRTAKRGLWEAMLLHYPGQVAKTPAGTIKIERLVVDANKDRPSSPSPVA